MVRSRVPTGQRASNVASSSSVQVWCEPERKSCTLWVGSSLRHGGSASSAKLMSAQLFQGLVRRAKRVLSPAHNGLDVVACHAGDLAVPDVLFAQDALDRAAVLRARGRGEGPVVAALEILDRERVEGSRRRAPLRGRRRGLLAVEGCRVGAHELGGARQAGEGDSLAARAPE